MVEDDAGQQAWAEALAAAHELVEHIESVVAPHMTVRSTDQARLFELAALARATRLFKGMITLCEEGSADVAPVLARPIVECWVIGHFLALSPSEGLEVLKEDVKFQQVRMGKNGWDDLAEFSKQLEWEPKGISWKDLHNRVGELLRESHGDLAPDAIRVYDVQYRSLSFMDSHSAMGAFLGHIETGESFHRVEMKRAQPSAAPYLLLMAAHNVQNLGGRVAYDIGLSLDRFERIGSRLLEIVSKLGDQEVS